ncbi:MAG: HlyC/CorC family transporter [Proteobacteria bacterium]|nr:MAG: HlyC/CorC family transporter [Pseudomonadota bacterium]
MDDLPIGVLFGALVFLIILSAFFSGSETGLMTLNRYRLRHLARAGHGGARRASELLKRPDRLIGLILLGNNFVNILASALATVLSIQLLGEAGPWVATAVLTVVILLFAEVAPKTLAALNPERIAFPAAFVYKPLLKVLYPLVWLVNAMANGLLHLIGVRTEQNDNENLSREELRIVVAEAGALIPKRHQKMLLGILDLEKARVEDIMIPRNEIVGIDLEDDTEVILDQLTTSQYTRLPVYREHIDNVVGFLHLRDVLNLLDQDRFDKEQLAAACTEPLFIPENTPLNKQLLNFQRKKDRIGLVVDEYGDIQGLVALDDVLEEIVGEFTTDPSTTLLNVYPQEDGSVMVDGSMTVRELNRTMNWKLPVGGPKTLNGLILEFLESIPESGTSLRLGGYPMEIVQVKGNAVKKAKVYPHLWRAEAP